MPHYVVTVRNNMGSEGKFATSTLADGFTIDGALILWRFDEDGCKVPVKVYSNGYWLTIALVNPNAHIDRDEGSPSATRT